MSKRVFVFDTETAALPAKPNGKTPEFACAGWLEGDEFCWTAQLEKARARVQRALDEGDRVVGHNVAFDLDVLGIVPSKTADVYDTMIADMLYRLAKDDGGWYGADRFKARKLEVVAGVELEGKGDVQLSFVPGHLPTGQQVRYLEGDVRATLKAYTTQQRGGMPPGGVNEQRLQVRAFLALRKLERTGLHIDQAELQRQRLAFQKLQHAAAMTLKDAGFYTPKRKGPKGGEYKEKTEIGKFREYVSVLCDTKGIKPKLTDTNKVSVDHEFLLELQDDPTVAAMCQYKDAEKILGTFLKAWDAPQVFAQYSGLMRTGRTSCSSPNFQQIPSRGKRGEVKQVFVPPPGCVFYEIDFAQLELCTLAFWVRGNLLKAINSGVDVHRYLGSVYFRKPADQVTKDERQLMKAANFGLPGGMGPDRFRSWIRASGLPDPGHEGAADLINAWLTAYPEMTEWLADSCPIPRHVRDVWAGKEERYTSEVIERAWAYAWDHLPVTKLPAPLYHGGLKVQKGSKELEVWLTHRSVIVSGGRKRCPVSYTEERNTKFQGLAANLTKEALAALVLDHPNLCTVHAFVHDSVLISVPDLMDNIAWARAAGRVMIEAGAAWIPGVRLGVEISGPGHNWYEAKHGEEEKMYNF